MTIKVCKTGEITEKEWGEFVREFNRAFDRQSTASDKKRFYSSNPYGYSYHAFALSDKGIIVGHTSLIPSQYWAGDKKVMMGISGGTFVSEEYRKNIFLFKRMYDQLKQYAKPDGMTATLGVPNSNSFKYATKILKKKYVGDLDYFALPIRPGNIMNVSGKPFINAVTYFGVIIWYWILRIYSQFHNPAESRKMFERVKSDQFLEMRFSNGYKEFNKNNFRCYYKLENEDGIDVAYILYASNESVTDLSALLEVSGLILKNENVDLIMYIGSLNIFPRFLFKVPESKIPKKLPLTIDVMDEVMLSSDIYKIKNWKFGLIDFDVR